MKVCVWIRSLLYLADAVEHRDTEPETPIAFGVTFIASQQTAAPTYLRVHFSEIVHDAVEVEFPGAEDHVLPRLLHLQRETDFCSRHVPLMRRGGELRLL